MGKSEVTPYWSQDGITIYLGDCLDIMPKLAPVKHVITDPPYEEQAHTKGRRRAVGTVRSGNANVGWKGRGGETRIEVLPFAAITETLRSRSAYEIARLAQAWALVFCQAEAAHIWDRELQRGGHTSRRWCVWIKPDGQPQFSGDRPGVGYETIVTTHTKGRSVWNGGGRVGVFNFIKNVSGSKRPQYHPTEKPLLLMRELVRLFTNEGDTILDPFMGSGSTLVAAKSLGRKAIGIELSKDWCDIAITRLTSRQGSIIMADKKADVLKERGYKPLI